MYTILLTYVIKKYCCYHLGVWIFNYMLVKTLPTPVTKILYLTY